MTTGILARMSEVARDTIQKELQGENLSQLIETSDPHVNSKAKVVNLICHKILEKIHIAFEEDEILGHHLKSRQKTLPHPEGVFYTDVEKKVNREIEKLNIPFTETPIRPNLAPRATYPRINDVCSKIFAFFKF